MPDRPRWQSLTDEQLSRIAARLQHTLELVQRSRRALRESQALLAPHRAQAKASVLQRIVLGHFFVGCVERPEDRTSGPLAIASGRLTVWSASAAVAD